MQHYIQYIAIYNITTDMLVHTSKESHSIIQITIMY